MHVTWYMDVMYIVDVKQYSGRHVVHGCHVYIVDVKQYSVGCIREGLFGVNVSVVFVITTG